MRKIALMGKNKVLLGEAGACVALVSTLQEHHSNAAVCEHACNAMRKIALMGKNKVLLGEAGACVALVSALQEHHSNAAVCVQACGAMSIAANDKNKVLLGGFNEERGCIECGLIFTASNGKQVFCSEQCKYKNQYRRRKESGNTGYDGEYMRKYHKQRRETDPQFNMIGRIRHRTRLAIKNGGFTKKSKTYEMLGCDWTTLKDHIEKQFATGMSWDNMNEWDLDHIYPLSWCSTIEELEIYSHYTNLQPLWRKDNLSKGNKFIG
jgi:hypothetical protein